MGHLEYDNKDILDDNVDLAHNNFEMKWVGVNFELVVGIGAGCTVSHFGLVLRHLLGQE